MKTPMHWQDSVWHRILPIALLFWMSASLVLDLLVMPVLYQSGMMADSHFVLAGQALFSAFNRMELLLGAIVLVCIAIKQQLPLMERESPWRNVPIAVLMFGIAILYSYGITPAMSGLGFAAESSGVIPESMGTMHIAYWALEGVKLMGLGILFNRDFQLFH